MFRLNKVKLLLVIILNLAASAYAMSPLKKSLIVGSAIAPSCWVDYISDQKKAQRLTRYLDASSEQAQYVKALLLKNKPKDLDCSLIDKIQFKIEEDNDLSCYSGSKNPIMFIPCNPQLLPAGAYLHELGHIYHQDNESDRLGTKVGLAVLSSGHMWYVLQKTPKISSLMEMGMLVGGVLTLGVIQNIFKYKQEQRADKFAIDCLKEHKNISGLKKVEIFFDEQASDEKREIRFASHRGNLREKLLVKALQGPVVVRAQVDPHPPAYLRSQKVRKAILELKE